MTPPRVSFVIPTLNSAATLEPCLRSITEQNYRKLDIVIVDGGSRDSTLDMASKYGARVLSRTGTLGLARQVGCEASRGDVLGIFDSDVVLPNVNWLTGAVAHFQSNSRVAVVWPINAAPPNSSRVTKSYFQLWRAFMEDRRAGTVLPGGNSLVLKRVFDEVGGFDVRLQFGEDFDLTRKIIAAGFEVAIHTDPIYHNTMRTLREFTTKQIKAAASLSAIMRRNRGLGQRLIWESMTWSPQRTGRVSQPLPLQAVRQMMVGVMWPTQKESQGGGVRSLLLIPTLLSIRLMIYAPYYTFAKLLTQEEAAYPRVRTVTEEKTSQFPEGEIRKAPLPKVSFVIPVLNSQRTLERCLSTINEQNYPSVELVVVDNGCTDKSIPIAIEHGAKVLACQGPLGKVRQFGHQNSSGELLAFWDSDLYIPRSDWLRNAVFCLLRHPRASTLWVLKDPPREAPVVSWAYNWLTWSVLLTLLGKGIGYLGGGG